MDTKGRLIARSHNRNEFAPINADEIGRLMKPDIFDFIEKHNLYDAIREKVVQLMMIDCKRAISLLIHLRDQIHPSDVVSQIIAARDKCDTRYFLHDMQRLLLHSLVYRTVSCKDLLQPFNPIPKFIIIKSVVFLTYWQGVLVFLAAKTGFIKDTEEAAEFQNFIVCVEMLIAAVGHLYAFPYKEYAGANIGGSRSLRSSLAHALMLNDFYHDTVHQFAPTYHDYVLYNHNEGEEGARKYRARTFVPIGPEMDAVRRNKLEDIQLSSLPSSGSVSPRNPGTGHTEALNSSLLMDSSHTVSVPYDMSLIDIDMSNYDAKVPAASEPGRR